MRDLDEYELDAVKVFVRENLTDLRSIDLSAMPEADLREFFAWAFKHVSINVVPF